MSRISKNILLGLALILSGAVAGSFYRGQANNFVTHSELFELKRNCATLAQEFADKKSEPRLDLQVTLKLRHSNYNIERKSCFGEFDKFVFFPGSPKDSFSQYEIYDLLTGQQIAALATTDRNPATSDWTNYFREYGPEYDQTRRQVLGLPRIPQ